jgi:hypothetical protein
LRDFGPGNTLVLVNGKRRAVDDLDLHKKRVAIREQECMALINEYMKPNALS